MKAVCGCHIGPIEYGYPFGEIRRHDPESCGPQRYNIFDQGAGKIPRPFSAPNEDNEIQEPSVEHVVGGLKLLNLPLNRVDGKVIVDGDYGGWKQADG